MVKEIERKLESVHKERQSVIESLRNIVKGSYQKGYNSLSVNTRIYGSMASGLAIEQSDVDLAVVGLDFQGNRDL
jgi:DNA polymerase sigma